MSAARWVVDRGHGWLEVPLGEAVTASLEVRSVSQVSRVNRELGLAYLAFESGSAGFEDCDAGVWLEWRFGSDMTGAGLWFACSDFEVYRVDGWSWVRELPRFEVLDSDPRAGGRIGPDDIPGVLS